MFVTDKDELEHSRLVDNYLAGGKGMSVYAEKVFQKFKKNSQERSQRSCW